MENVKGFKRLTADEQELLIMVNRKHKSGVGVEYKDGYTPVEVTPLPFRLGVRVRFKNGIWLHYGTDGSWY